MVRRLAKDDHCIAEISRLPDVTKIVWITHSVLADKA